MKKILFSHSYFYKFDKKQWRIAEPYPPLMTITAASVMRNEGYDVELFDSGLKDSADEILPLLESYQPDYFVVFDDGFNYLTKMCLTTMRQAAFEMQKYAQNIGATVITCSSDSTDHYEKYLSEGADFVIKGEGEQTLLELINTLEANGNKEAVQGVCFEKGDSIFTSAQRPVVSDLDSLPQAAWDLINIEEYREVWLRKHGRFSLNIATTRGCPYKCNWCAKPIYGQRYNNRSPERVADEIDYLNREFDVDYFWMCDDIFGLKPNWVQQFDEALNKRNLEIKYKIQTRADLLLKEDNIMALVKSGLDTAWMGAESGSQKILDAMDKGTEVDQIAVSTELLKKHDVKVAFFLQFGYPGETKEDIKKTLDMVLGLMPDELGISVSYPLPGTKFYEKVKGDLKAKSNWVDSDDMDMMFISTYHPKFYKKLHTYIHNRFRTKRAWEVFKKKVRYPFGIKTRDVKQMVSVLYHLPMSVLNRVILFQLSQKKM